VGGVCYVVVMYRNLCFIGVGQYNCRRAVNCHACTLGIQSELMHNLRAKPRLSFHQSTCKN